jgi:hypothetical protein
MERKSFYDEGAYKALQGRIARLTAQTEPQWGRMNAAQMCAHCAEVAEVAGGKPLAGTPWYVRLLGGLIKKLVLSDKPYPRSTRTHPQYLIPTTVEFDAQQARLLAILADLDEAGRAGAEGTVHPIFGAMTAEETGWATYKHLDHHLTQFGV